MHPIVDRRSTMAKRDALQGELNSLQDFIGSTGFEELPTDERYSLATEGSVMCAYLLILNARIFAWSAEED